MTKEWEKYLIQVAKTTAELIHYACSWEDAMDGDETELISKTILKELDELNGNN